jgi:hypothetical protein
MPEKESFDPSAVYQCRGCKEDLPAGAVSEANWEWYQVHGAYHSDCWALKCARQRKIKEINKARREAEAEVLRTKSGRESAYFGQVEDRWPAGERLRGEKLRGR